MKQSSDEELVQCAMMECELPQTFAGCDQVFVLFEDNDRQVLLWRQHEDTLMQSGAAVWNTSKTGEYCGGGFTPHLELAVEWCDETAQATAEALIRLMDEAEEEAWEAKHKIQKL